MKIFPIANSKLRNKLIAYYFSNIDAEHYLREIASILNLDPGNLSKELNALEKEGVFISQVRGRIKLYRLNKSYPFFNELKSIVFRSIGIEGSIREVLRKIDGIEIAFIFGSFASAKELANSDIDLFIMGNPDEKILNRNISEIEKKIGREINYLLWPKKEVIKKLKEKNSFLKEIFANKKIFIVGTQNELKKLSRKR
jgi:predicted nucleotidyltransferase/predicted transcriptional regulator with HTH domain